MLTLQRLCDGCRIGRVVGDQLGNPVNLWIGHFQHPPNITQRGPCLQRSKGDDLRHPVMTIFFLHIPDHLLAPVLTEINIEIRHGNALGIQEPLK